MECLQRYGQALEATAHLSESLENTRRAIDVRLDYETPLQWLGQIGRLESLLREAESLGRKLGDPERLAAIFERMSMCCRWQPTYRQGINYGEQAITLANSIDDQRRRIWAVLNVALNEGFLGNHRACVERLVALVEGPDSVLAKRTRGAFGSLFSMGSEWLSYWAAVVGEFQRSYESSQRCVEAAEDLDNLQSRVLAHFLRGSARQIKGEFDEAAFSLQHARDLSEAAGLTFFASASSILLGRVFVDVGRFEEGVASIEEGLGIQVRIGTMCGRSLFHVHRAVGLLGVGRLDDARQAAERALEIAVRLSERGYEAEAHAILGRILVAVEDAHAARDSFERALALGTELGMRPLVAHCHLGLGRLYRRTGKRQEAQESLATARTMYREMDMTYWLEQAEAELKGNT